MSKLDALKVAVARCRKAIVAAVALAVYGIVVAWVPGIDVNTLTVVIGAALNGAITYLVPNAKPYLDGDENE